MSIERNKSIPTLFVMMVAIIWICTACNWSADSKTEATSIPKVDLVYPLAEKPFHEASGVLFTEDFETIGDLNDRFHDTGGTPEGRMRTSEDRMDTSEGLMLISETDAFSGNKSAQNTYVAKKKFLEGEDPGSAGWFWYFLGDNNLEGYFPIADTTARTRLFARWYHKFEEGFSSQDSTGTLPPKMARMRCFDKTWRANYTVLFWIEGADGHISIQQHTRAPGVEREWRPNYHTSFLLNNPGNLGRWIHLELGVILGDGHFSDRIQAWADGILICDIDKQDLAGGYRENTLNAMSWDCYWNGGSPRAQSRYYDDLVLSDTPIGPARTSLTPCIRKAAYMSENGEALKEWQVEVAQTQQKPESIDDPERRQPKMQYSRVWMGEVDGEADTVCINGDQGSFIGTLSAREQLDFNTLYSVRLRQRAKGSEWSDWSEWHSAFSTLWKPDSEAGERPPAKGYLTGHMIK